MGGGLHKSLQPTCPHSSLSLALRSFDFLRRPTPPGLVPVLRDRMVIVYLTSAEQQNSIHGSLEGGKKNLRVSDFRPIGCRTTWVVVCITLFERYLRDSY